MHSLGTRSWHPKIPVLGNTQSNNNAFHKFASLLGNLKVKEEKINTK